MPASKPKQLAVVNTDRYVDRSHPQWNQIREADRVVHDWYRFVLSYPPHLVQEYVEKFQLNEKHRVLDPFCGTGTTVVECKKLGIASVGIEANRLAHFAGSTKLNWKIKPRDLLKAAKQIADRTRKILATETELRKFSADAQKILLKGCLSPIPTHKVLVLREQIEAYENPELQPHLWLALTKALVNGISNIYFGPEVTVGKAKHDAQVIDLWLSIIEQIASDLTLLRKRPDTEAFIHHADSRDAPKVLEPNSIDAVITSPPYPNEKDYTRTTRLESVVLGLLKNKADLRALKEGLMRSNTRNVYVADQDDLWVANHPEVQRVAQAIEDRRIELGKTSGFERLYCRATKLYFGGMARHLADLRPALRPGAQLAYVVGDQASYLQVMIRTGQLLANIAEGLGYECTNIDLFRTRISTATKEQLREEVVLLRWPGAMPTTPYPYGPDTKSQPSTD
ncbi:DNA methyltransferase [filamentous cyanobacterium LEGE 11480]|uniref:site-specific DNA-methyltransferase (cytosine-N(4)-specific) n=1 Tax=Romeriopsis navalis LEGE 11480 TaxID=2777977 RepID=A0A928Z2R6_9CYAN|nr:DNA methyltransferase [Romeriopsis navalis]MBE9028640.1 DNA methyltransferase [Romeriopsis navalis LEGE 11480]